MGSGGFRTVIRRMHFNIRVLTERERGMVRYVSYEDGTNSRIDDGQSGQRVMTGRLV